MKLIQFNIFIKSFEKDIVMLSRVKRLFKKKFVQNVFIVASGAVGAQALSLLLSPIITRLYGPEAFGVLGTFTALTRIVIPIAALTYPVAIVLPKSDSNAKKIIKLSFIITIFMSILSLLILLVFKKPVIDLFNLNDINNLIFLIPVVIFFAGLMQITVQWVIRTNQFLINAKSEFYHSLIANFSKVGIGFFLPVASVLVVIQTLAQGIRALLIILFLRKNKTKSINNSSNEKELSIKETAKKHYDFPLYRAPEELISTLSQNLPVLLLTSFFGPAAAGFYSIGRTVLSMPSRLIGRAIGDVFYPRITEAKHKGEDLNKLIKKATLTLAGFGILPFGIVIIFGPFLFSFVFGEDWLRAGEYARWIALFSFSTYLNQPAIKSLAVLSKQRFHLLFTIFRAAARISGLLIGLIIFENDLIAVALFGIISLITNFMLIFIILRMSKTKK